VLDYLVDEVLQQQRESVQTFLLRTSTLERLCAPLCDAILLALAGYGQATLEYIERANPFIAPLDSERRWYCYHHLFDDPPRQRIASTTAKAGVTVDELHQRASQWYEDHDLDIEAFHHAAAGSDIERAVRLVEGRLRTKPVMRTGSRTKQAELLRTGALVPVIHRRYPLSKVPAAIRYLIAIHAQGKVVITL
jgi:ATP/maltotriose-dependent transcriptional regulator MalT